jgi:hypothetical protein
MRSGGRNPEFMAGSRRLTVALGAAGTACARSLAFKPLQELTQQECSDTDEDDGKNRFPHQSVHELIDLRVRHGRKQSNSSAALCLACLAVVSEGGSHACRAVSLVKAGHLPAMP